MTSILNILDEFRKEAESQRDLGDRFERFLQAYLQTDPYYQDLFSHVWLWMEYPKRGNSPDIGIKMPRPKNESPPLLWRGLASSCCRPLAIP
jgi:predicted helicase